MSFTDTISKILGVENPHHTLLVWNGGIYKYSNDILYFQPPNSLEWYHFRKARDLKAGVSAMKQAIKANSPHWHTKWYNSYHPEFLLAVIEQQPNWNL